MTNKDFKEGMPITCSIDGIEIDDAKLHYEDKNGYICHNVRELDEDDRLEDYLGYEYSFNLCDDGKYGEHHVADIKPRTIDDLECGDYVVDNCGNKRRCLGKCGEICFLSRIGNDETSDGIGPLSRIKSLKYTLYQPTEEKETDIDKCIKVVEEFFEGAYKEGEEIKLSLVKRLKNLKK